MPLHHRRDVALEARARRAPRPGPSGIRRVRSMSRSWIGVSPDAWFTRGLPRDVRASAIASSQHALDQLVVRQPSAFAAIGTRLVGVMPGMVFTSRQYGSFVAARAGSPRAPRRGNRARAPRAARQLATCAAPAASGRSAGQKYSLAPGGVLRFVVVEPALGRISTIGRGCIAEHRDRQLAARDELPRSGSRAP